MGRIADISEKVLNHLIVWCGILLLAALFIQVVNRYFLAVSWPFIQMLIPLCFVWLSMLGSAVAVRKKLHFEIDLISGRLRPKARRYYAMAIAFSMLLGGIITVWGGVGLIKLGFVKTDPSTGASMIYAYASIFMGGALICLFAFEQFWNRWTQSPASEGKAKT
jgi:TRAP-type C4-dicarboxylate transport system permease small subunit